MISVPQKLFYGWFTPLSAIFQLDLSAISQERPWFDDLLSDAREVFSLQSGAEDLTLERLRFLPLQTLQLDLFTNRPWASLVAEEKTEVLHQVDLIGYFAGYCREDAVLLATNDLHQYLISNEVSPSINAPSIARTLGQIVAGDDYMAGAKATVEFLRLDEWSEYQTQYVWDEVFLQTIFLLATWRGVAGLPIADQNWLLKNYIFRSLMIGIPLQRVLTEIIQSIHSDPVRVVTLYSIYAEAFDGAGEKIGVKTVAEILHEYVGNLERGGVIDAQQVIGDVLRGEKNIPAQVLSALREAARLYRLIVAGELIDVNKVGVAEHFVELERKKKALETCWQWYFQPTSEHASQLKKTLQQNAAILSSFLFSLRSHISLEKPGAIKRILDFQAQAREAGVLGHTQDMIIFNETDGQFEWNEEII